MGTGIAGRQTDRSNGPDMAILKPEELRFRSTSRMADHQLPGTATSLPRTCSTGRNLREYWCDPVHQTVFRAHPMTSLENMPGQVSVRSCAIRSELTFEVCRDHQPLRIPEALLETSRIAYRARSFPFCFACHTTAGSLPNAVRS